MADLDATTSPLHPSVTVGSFSAIAAGARIGARSRIGAGCVLGSAVALAEDVFVADGARILGSVAVAAGAQIGPNATFTDQPFAFSGATVASGASTRVGPGATIHAGAIILPGLTIGAHAQVGPGAVVAHSVPDFAIVTGNPARIVGYVGAVQGDSGQSASALGTASEGAVETLVKGVTLHRLPLITDIRGSLSVGEFERSLPFPVKRYFMVFGVPSLETRGEHAHRACREFLVCVAGSCSVLADDGHSRQEFRLDKPNVGIFLPAMVWRVHYKYTADAILVAFASEYYDPSDYIRTYPEFLDAVGARG